jgi:hypothetical protein
MKTWKWMCAAIVLVSGSAFAASEPAPSELACSDFKPTPEAAARFAALKGACDAIVQMNGTTYARFNAIVRRVSAGGGSVTLNLPATDSTFTVNPKSDARVLLGGEKARVRDLQRGQKIQIYLSTDEFAQPNIHEIELVSADSSDVVPVAAEPVKALPTTASPLPFVAVLGAAMLALGIALSLVARRRRVS